MTKRKSRVSRSHGDSLVYYLLHSKTPHIIQEWSGMTTMNGAQRAPAAAAVGVCAKNGICGRRELWQESSEHMQPYKYRKCTLCSPITGALDSEENFSEFLSVFRPKIDMDRKMLCSRGNEDIMLGLKMRYRPVGSRCTSYEKLNLNNN